MPPPAVPPKQPGLPAGPPISPPPADQPPPNPQNHLRRQQRWNPAVGPESDVPDLPDEVEGDVGNGRAPNPCTVSRFKYTPQELQLRAGSIKWRTTWN